ETASPIKDVSFGRMGAKPHEWLFFSAMGKGTAPSVAVPTYRREPSYIGASVPLRLIQNIR
ncbi:MAG: hypothetical protein ACQEQV_05450, partial [Fibrobacterota bacterium]